MGMGRAGASIKVIDGEVDGRVRRMDTEGPADEARFSDLIIQLASIPALDEGCFQR
jgi:hypothetical protein